MVAQKMLRMYDVKKGLFRKKNRKRPILHHTCATFSDLPSYVSTMVQPCCRYNVVCLPLGSKPPSVFQNPETFGKGHYSLR